MANKRTVTVTAHDLNPKPKLRPRLTRHLPFVDLVPSAELSSLPPC